MNTINGSSLKELVSETQELIAPKPKTNYLMYIVGITFLLLNLYTYYFHRLDIFRYLYRKLFTSNITPITEVTRPIIKNSETKSVDKEEENAPDIDKIKVEEEEESDTEPEPDSTDLKTIQEKKKNGWCYIGTDRGYRSCVKMGNNDVCLSSK